MEKPKLDFIGLQYYSDPLLNLLRGSVARTPDQDLTSYDYRTYPQGLSSAIEECSTLGVPIDLTEIGIDIGINQGDLDDTRRIRYFNRIFQVVEKALEEGKEVRSLYFWTLIDNLEWHKGWTIPFGLYSRTPEGEIKPRGMTTWLQNLES
jgi:beta-glucosidase